MRKINIGAGIAWQHDGWETLDNVPGDYSRPWQHSGKCWDTRLPDHAFDVVFTCHMLEHVPHFRMERTIAEFNRIAKVGSTLRILVPNLKVLAKAYVEGDTELFASGTHYTDHLGIGGSFMSKMISPGRQTLAISREFDEVIGGYAHLYHFDFEMLQILLTKWGYGDIRNPEYCVSTDTDMTQPQAFVVGGKAYPPKDPYILSKEYIKTGDPWYITGFDKAPVTSLIVEATKIKDVPYDYDMEYAYNKRARFDGLEERVKLRLMGLISKAVDFAFKTAKALRIHVLVQRLKK